MHVFFSLLHVPDLCVLKYQLCMSQTSFMLILMHYTARLAWFMLTWHSKRLQIRTSVYLIYSIHKAAKIHDRFYWSWFSVAALHPVALLWKGSHTSQIFFNKTSSDRQSLFWSEISYNKPPPRLPGLAY